jgi:hypothetical protein
MMCHIKSCLMAFIVPLFWNRLTTFVGRIDICWGSFSFTWKIFIHPNTMFPPLLNTIPLVGLDVLFKIIQDFLKCYLSNAVVFVYPHFVIMWNWNWNKNYLTNCSYFACLNISKISLWKKLLKIFKFIVWMLLILFVFKAFGLWVEIHTPSTIWWLLNVPPHLPSGQQVVICMFPIHVITEFPI